MRMLLSNAFRNLVFHSVIAAFALCIAPQTIGLAQTDGEKSSRRESSLVDRIEKAGGRISKISAADDSKEASFYLSDKPVTDDVIKGINALPQIIWVNLANSEITNEGLAHLKGLPLKKLHLEKTGIGDEGLKHLKGFKELEYLNLYGSKVTDAGLDHLAGLKKLKRLYVWQTGVTEAGMEKLRKSLPDLEIIGEVKLEPVVVETPKKKEDDKKANDKEAKEANDKAGEDKKKDEAKEKAEDKK